MTTNFMQENRIRNAMCAAKKKKARAAMTLLLMLGGCAAKHTLAPQAVFLVEAQDSGEPYREHGETQPHFTPHLFLPFVSNAAHADGPSGGLNVSSLAGWALVRCATGRKARLDRRYSLGSWA